MGPDSIYIGVNQKQLKSIVIHHWEDNIHGRLYSFYQAQAVCFKILTVLNYKV